MLPVFWSVIGSVKRLFAIVGSCLIFLPSQGTLDYNARSSYIVTVGCTDDRDLEVVGTVEVRLLANTPPAFTAPLGTREDNKVTATKTRNFGYEVYDVNAADLDGDPIYYTMSTDPDTGLFDIGYANGQITFSQDPRLLCDQTVDFYVTAFDKHHPNGVGPVVIDTEFTDTDGISGDLFYRVKAIPERGLDLYYLDDYKEKRIRVKDALDYEYADLRTVTLTIDITDGFCDAPTQTVTIEITDVNEPPEIKPTYREISVYEGFISVDPQWTLLDPDESENHKWSLVSGGGGKFDVSEHSGVINSDGNLDIDPNKVNQNFNMKVRVEDKDGEKADAERMYEFNANPCTKVGAVLGQVNAKDDDSEHQGNNVLVFSGASNNMTVTSMGDVILTNPCEPEGASDFALAHVTDLGQYPAVPVASARYHNTVYK
nr:hypothetical protein BaRGS_012044 [Batillaria attramentaria]